jgi:mRNA interferase RelE/StbE
MTIYLVEYTPAAARQIRKLNKTIQARLKSKIAMLSENPRPHGSKKLKSFEKSYRIRVGDYRVIYDIHDDVLLVLIMKVGPRRDVYD